jgi:outer membrane lipoprotein-sorting protein
VGLRQDLSKPHNPISVEDEAMRVVLLVALSKITVLLLVGGVLVRGADLPPEAAKAKKLFDRMADAYGKCKTYRDTGVVETIFFEGNRKRTVRYPFETAFVAPDQFRYESKSRRGEGEDEYNHYILWKKGKDLRTWWDLKPGVIEEPKSFPAALGGAAGASGGSSNHVPLLLHPKELGGRITTLKDPKQIDDANLGDIECHRVEGLYGNQLTTVWIDQKTFLLRQLQSKMTFEKFRTETTTSYHPTIDEEIAEKKLELNPPKR